MIKALLVGKLTWNIPLLSILLLIFTAYIIYLFKMRKDSPIRIKQIVTFTLGLLLLLLAIGSPLLAISYLSFSLHMIQMSVLFFIIPPLLILGIPDHALENVFFIFNSNKSINTSIIPKVSLIIFATLFFFYHLPFVLSFVSSYTPLQNGYLTVLFILAFPMWWPITNPVPKQRLLKLRRNHYIFQSGLYITPACLMFIVFALMDGINNPFLSEMTMELCLPDENGAHNLLPPPFNTKYDQMMAGVFMLGLHKFSLLFTDKLGKTTR